MSCCKRLWDSVLLGLGGSTNINICHTGGHPLSRHATQTQQRHTSTSGEMLPASSINPPVPQGFSPFTPEVHIGEPRVQLTLCISIPFTVPTYKKVVRLAHKKVPFKHKFTHSNIHAIFWLSHIHMLVLNCCQQGPLSISNDHGGEDAEKDAEKLASPSYYNISASYATGNSTLCCSTSGSGLE